MTSTVPNRRWCSRGAPRRPVPTPAPNDAVVLFDGTSLDAWKAPEGGPAAWRVKDGVLEVVPGAGPIETKGKFGDIQLHVEWAAPDPPDGVGQDRGNSGDLPDGPVRDPGARLLQGRHLRRRPGRGDLRPVSPAVQRLAPARRVADLRHRLPPAPVRRRRQAPASRRGSPLFHNGILVQNNEEPWGPTPGSSRYPYDPGVTRGPIQLQDHEPPRAVSATSGSASCPSGPRPTAKDVRNPELVTTFRRASSTRSRASTANPSRAASEPFLVSREGGHLDLKLPVPTHAPAPRTDLRDGLRSCPSPTAASPSRRTARAA